MANLYGIGKHDTTHSPVGLWQFDGTLLDSSGFGRDLSLDVGTERYTEINPGLKALWLDGATRVQHAVYDAALHILGDLTIEMLLAVAEPPTAVNSFDILAHGLWPESPSDRNSAYRLYISEAGSRLRYSHNYSTTGEIHSIDDCVATGHLTHLAVTRTSNVVQLYLNGAAIGAASGTLTAPDGGTSGRLTVGGLKGDSSRFFVGGIASLKIISSALNAAQILAEYNLTIGAVLPRVTP